MHGYSLQDQGVGPEDCIDDREPTMIRADLSLYGEFYHEEDQLPEMDGTIIRFRRRFSNDEFKAFGEELSRFMARWDLDPYAYHRLWVLKYFFKEEQVNGNGI